MFYVLMLCGRPPQYASPPASWPLNFLTLKVVYESCDVGYLFPNFSLPSPLSRHWWTFALSTLFRLHDRHRYTWNSPDGVTRSQIDYIMISKQWKQSVNNARTCLSADCDSDHNIVVLTMQLRFKMKRVAKSLLLDLDKLRTDQFKQQYQVEVTNRFGSSWRTSHWMLQRRQYKKTVKNAKAGSPVTPVTPSSSLKGNA